MFSGAAAAQNINERYDLAEGASSYYFARQSWLYPNIIRLKDGNGGNLNFTTDTSYEGYDAFVEAGFKPGDPIKFDITQPGALERINMLFDVMPELITIKEDAIRTEAGRDADAETVGTYD